MTDNLNFGYAEPDYGANGVPFSLAMGGCSAVFMGQMMHFGGTFEDSPNTRHYSIIKDCGMDVQYPDMPFDFYDGACHSFLKPTPNVLLCFSSADDVGCYT